MKETAVCLTLLLLLTSLIGCIGEQEDEVVDLPPEEIRLNHLMMKVGSSK